MQYKLTNLGGKTGDELVAIMRAIPATVTFLDLSRNGFSFKTVVELVALLAAIPASVTSLKLSQNSLGLKTGDELVALMAAILPTLTSLDLSTNGLYNKTPAELAKAFAALPASVTTLNLSGNKLNAKQLDAIMNALPVGVETIILDDKVIDLNEVWAEHLLVDVTHFTAKQGMARFAFDTIVPPTEIDVNRLNRFIEFLEKQNNPIADLTCGLLLEGQIETTTDILENCSEYDEHRERRNYDAISFYTKAANDVTIKPIAEFLLWQMKASSLFASVQNRLAQYEITPQGTYIIDSYNKATKGRGIITPILASLGLFKPSVESELYVETQTGLEL